MTFTSGRASATTVSIALCAAAALVSLSEGARADVDAKMAIEVANNAACTARHAPAQFGDADLKLLISWVLSL